MLGEILEELGGKYLGRGSSSFMKSSMDTHLVLGDAAYTVLHTLMRRRAAMISSISGTERGEDLGVFWTDSGPCHVTHVLLLIQRTGDSQAD